MKNTERFNGKGPIYEKTRPTYPEQLLDAVSALAEPGAAVADIGAGTGIFTVQLLKRGYEVYAVEPNGSMRFVLERQAREYGHLHVINAAAENTGVAPGSCMLVCAAQSFHWFDAKAFAEECRRILKPNGKTLIIYNFRDREREPVQRLELLCRGCCEEFKGFSNGISECDIEKFFSGRCERMSFPNDLHYSRNGFVGRMLSSSFAPKDPAGEERYIAALEEFFYKNCENGVLTLPNNTLAFIGYPGI